jgi:class 3 adenylate cyclase
MGQCGRTMERCETLSHHWGVRELPTGTVTFLFTDVEGSTRLLEELGGRYVEALAEQRRIVREACARYGGVEIDTQGDAFFVAFADARAAAQAAAEAQAELASGPMRVRMGMHTGEPIVWAEGYAGVDGSRTCLRRSRFSSSARTSFRRSGPCMQRTSRRSRVR